MSDRMLSKVSKYMSEYMTGNARVGITRIKVILVVRISEIHCVNVEVAMIADFFKV